MSNCRHGKERYEALIENIGEWASNDINGKEPSPKTVIDKAKTSVPEFVSGLRVLDLTAIHEYLMYTAEIRPDIRTPVYVYTGGDRIISVTRYLLKNIEYELAKQYA